MGFNKKDYVPATQHSTYTTGEAIKVWRDLNELTQKELAEKTKISQADISSLENDRVKLGVERAKVLAYALHIHPSMLLFPNWEAEQKEFHKRGIVA